MISRPTTIDRRQILAGMGALAALSAFGTNTTEAQSLTATETMRGGRNNYVANAPLVENLGTGFTVSGVVRRADTGAPAANTRIQIWAATERGGEREPSNRGSVMTDSQGRYSLQMSSIVPQFGQPHIHMAYDDGAYEPLFLRPVLESARQATLEVNIVLAPSGGSS